MKYKIKLDKVPNQTVKLNLDGNDYDLTFITRNGTLFLNTMSVGGENILSGIVCLDRNDIFSYIKDKINGSLYFEDLDGVERPNYEGFNDRWILVYEVNNVR